MASKQQINDFINTSPEAGEARFLYNTSNEVVGMTISIYDCNGTSRAGSISNLSTFTIGSDTLSTLSKQDKALYFYYEVTPVATGSLAAVEGTCTETSLTPPPKVTTFKNSEYNAVFNNAVNIRRLQRYETGSSGLSNGIFELVKTTSQLTPQNLDSVMSGSAATASFQESNIYSKAWTLPRYEGSKLDSGSLFFNDPALSFIGFEAAKFPLIESSSFIRSQSYADLDIQQYYFNPPYSYAKGLYDQGSTNPYPSPAQPVYEKIGKEYKRITKSKIFIPGTDDVIQLSDYQAFYETKPIDSNPGAVSGDNVFTVMVETIANQDFYYYFTGSNNALIGPTELRPGTSDVIQISGSYIPSTNSYAIDIIDSARQKHAIYSDGMTSVNNKTFVTILSSSNNA
jgi:hypothetical protein